jgi:rhodanese-related sulfurtransferase
MKKCIAFLFMFFFILVAHAQNTYHEISLPALMDKYQQDPSNMIIVDVRSDGEYYDSSGRFKSGNIGHIKGALHIELQDLDKKPESLKALEEHKNKEVYLICSHSYRSRRASNILTQNGFKNVNNVQGGMTEWYRRYDDLLPYRSSLETAVRYKNISSAQLHEMLAGNGKMLLIGINIVPHTFYDTANLVFLNYLPIFKRALFFNDSDSAKVMELAKKNGGMPIVLFNNFSYGGAEMADWLTGQGIPNVQYLVGGVSYFCEYLANTNLLQRTNKVLSTVNSISFITPLYYCQNLADRPGAVVVDLRHDTLYNKANSGMKANYTHLKASANFPATKGIAAFEKAYPDKKLQYVLLSRNGVEGIALADQLSKKGYTINWMLGGIPRFDWYITNVETTDCKDLLLY